MADFLTPGEMAKALRTPLSWIYSQTRKKGKNTIPMTRVGKYIRFEREKVLEWIQNGGATVER
jgi:excisionase family DNA binding protein